MNKSEIGKGIPIFCILTAVGLVLFWIGFFTVGLAPEKPPAGYFAYEHSFPPPDITLAIVLFIGAMMFLKGNAKGAVILAAAGGGLVFLGILDISFNLQNGMYCTSVMDMILNAFINLWCVIFGVVIVAKMMKIFQG
jgi:hypothetical protein